MNGSDASDALEARAPSPVSFEGTAEAGLELLHSPVSGQLCVHWRLRIVERLTPRSQLVHEVSSPDPFDLLWSGSDRGGGEPGRAGVRIRLEPQSARVHATPVLHREGTPGALATARTFGFAGPISVEEVVIRAGEALSAEGLLEDPDLAQGPFRATSRSLELLDATVRLDSRTLGPALLPWALGTAAALLGGVGLAGYGAWRYHLIHLPSREKAHLPRMFAPPPQIEPPQFPHPRLP